MPPVPQSVEIAALLRAQLHDLLQRVTRWQSKDAGDILAEMPAMTLELGGIYDAIGDLRIELRRAEAVKRFDSATSRLGVDERELEPA